MTADHVICGGITTGHVICGGMGAGPVICGGMAACLVICGGMGACHVIWPHLSMPPSLLASPPLLDQPQISGRFAPTASKIQRLCAVRTGWEGRPAWCCETRGIGDGTVVMRQAGMSRKVMIVGDLRVHGDCGTVIGWQHVI
jgi:hypothetical protein